MQKGIVYSLLWIILVLVFIYIYGKSESTALGVAFAWIAGAFFIVGLIKVLILSDDTYSDEDDENEDFDEDNYYHMLNKNNK